MRQRTNDGSMMENLEMRTLLSISLDNGVLRIVGTSGGDDIEVQKRADDNELRVDLNGDETEYPLGSVNRIVIRGLDGSDRIEYSGRDGRLDIPGNLGGGAGNDVIEGGNGNDTISGGAGNDRIQGKGGDDSVTGGGGNDFIEGGSGDDVLRGSSGDDDLSGGRGNDDLFGNGGDDDLEGNAGTDGIFGNSGNDDFDDSDSRSELKDRGPADNGANTNP